MAAVKWNGPVDGLTAEELHNIEAAIAFYIEEFEEGEDMCEMEDLQAKIQKELYLRRGVALRHAEQEKQK
jgi:hypothetical protein